VNESIYYGGGDEVCTFIGVNRLCVQCSLYTTIMPVQGRVHQKTLGHNNDRREIVGKNVFCPGTAAAAKRVLYISGFLCFLLALK